MPTNPPSQAPFRRVADELRTEILRGDLAPGAKLPSENQLADRFEVTRVTVRKGIALLKMEGLVTTHQGKGAFVRERPHVNLLSTGTNYRDRRATGVSNFNAEAEAQGRRAKQIIRGIDEVAAPDKVAGWLGVEPGSTVLVRRRLFVVDDSPMQFVDGYYDLNLAAGTPIAEPKRIRGGVHSVIEDPDGPIRRRIVQFVEELDIRMPTPDEAKQLEIPSGVPLARVLRTAYDSGGSAVEVLDSRVPCDRHVFRYVINV